MSAFPIQVAKKYEKNYIAGYPLIHRERTLNFPSKLPEGALIDLLTHDGKFIAKGYYGKQNKGDGWLFSSQKKADLDTSFFQVLIHHAVKGRQSFFADNSTTAFRLFNGEGDGLGGLTIDYYDGFLLLQWYSAGIYRYQKQFTHVLFDLPFVKGIYEKKRFKAETTPTDDFVGGQKAPSPLLIKENGIYYATYLNDGWMTGIFLDQRNVRQAISSHYAAGKSVLNTFSYTGAFSVAAAYGGARHTTSVDVASRSLEKTKEQFTINHIDPNSQSIIVEDVFHYFKYAVRHNLTYDLVVVDPPSFARTKKITFSAVKDYPELLKQVIQITAKNGIIVASTNCAGFGMEKFKKLIAKAFQESGRNYHIKERFNLPADFSTIETFREGNYLKVLFLQLD